MASWSARFSRQSSLSLCRPITPTQSIPVRALSKPAVGRYGQSINRLYSQRPSYRRYGYDNRFSYNWANSPRFRYGVGLVAAGGGVVWLTNRETVPVTGRKRFNIVSPEYERQAAEGEFRQILQSYQGKILPPEHPQSRQARRVMQRLVPVSGLENEKWEVRVINEPEIPNAFVLPGGKVFVFSGILPICKDDDGLAAVLAHEVSHNVAHHTGEKMSKSIWAWLGGIFIAYQVGIDPSAVNLLMEVAFSLPNSRTMEEEADRIGLLMMAKACYDPHSASELWKRMAQKGVGMNIKFLSTHPTDRDRVRKIEEWMPEAIEERDASECGAIGQSAFGAFRRASQRMPSTEIDQTQRISSDGDNDWF